MRKLFFIAALLSAALLTSCTEDRSSIVKVYNWSNYIDETVIPEFEEWYFQQTGEKVRVIYQTFDINETMLAKIEKGHEDYDVTCPSDYIIERMLNNGLLHPLDFASLPDSINYINNNKSPYVREVFRKINPEIDANDYSVAFMWGTSGILYNSKYVTDQEASSWDVFLNPKFQDRIFIKDACRDVFSPVLMHLRQKELKSGELTLDDLMLDKSDKSLSDVEAFMSEVKPLVAGWEADFGKEQMTQEKGWLSFNWSGDAVWAIEEAEEVGVDLKYIVPEEGSNVWFDGWVIPKYAKNIKAATYFIDFMCRPDIAIRNMDETGYVSANGDHSVLESQIDDDCEPIDVSYFFGEADTAVRVSPVLYPDKKTIQNCALMHDWGEDSAKLISMWSRVKGDSANTGTYVIILIAAAAIVIAVVAKKNKKAKRSHSKRH